jgi:hypothetical protein
VKIPRRISETVVKNTTQAETESIACALFEKEVVRRDAKDTYSSRSKNADVDGSCFGRVQIPVRIAESRAQP